MGMVCILIKTKHWSTQKVLCNKNHYFCAWQIEHLCFMLCLVRMWSLSSIFWIMVPIKTKLTPMGLPHYIQLLDLVPL